jgi:hypothetical protein
MTGALRSSVARMWAYEWFLARAVILRERLLGT